MFKLVQDEDCHWYVIPASKLHEFYAWAADPIGELPSWATCVNGAPERVQFPSFEIN